MERELRIENVKLKRLEGQKPSSFADSGKEENGEWFGNRDIHPVIYVSLYHLRRKQRGFL